MTRQVTRQKKSNVVSLRFTGEDYKLINARIDVLNQDINPEEELYWTISSFIRYYIRNLCSENQSSTF